MYWPLQFYSFFVITLSGGCSWGQGIFHWKGHLSWWCYWNLMKINSEKRWKCRPCCVLCFVCGENAEIYSEVRVKCLFVFLKLPRRETRLQSGNVFLRTSVDFFQGCVEEVKWSHCVEIKGGKKAKKCKRGPADEAKATRNQISPGRKKWIRPKNVCKSLNPSSITMPMVSLIYRMKNGDEDVNGEKASPTHSRYYLSF